jgi:hypothetical protein
VSEEFVFDIDSPDIRGLLAHIKQVDPKLATALRRELRDAGAEIIAGQRAILAGAKPGSVRKSGKRLAVVRPKNRRAYLAMRNTFDVGADKDEGSSNLRARIAQGLRTRIITGSRRQTVMVTTSGPREGGYNLALLWEKRMIRHPVFGNRSTWVYQLGRPFFWDPIRAQYVKVEHQIADAVEAILNQIGDS